MPFVSPILVTSKSHFCVETVLHFALQSTTPLQNNYIRKHARVATCILTPFVPSDFEIRRLVGQQGYATITDWEYYTPKDPLSPTRTVENNGPAIRLYEAVITSSIPRFYNTRVLLKEFLPPGTNLGVTEAETYNLLYRVSTDAPVNPDVVPVATLLGSFVTDESFADPSLQLSWRSRFPKSPVAPRVGAPFLVFRWEGLQNGLSCAAPPERNDGNGLFDSLFPQNLVRRKTVFLRTFIRKSVHALLYLHATAGLVHRSIGLASIMVNTSEYRLASSLLVKFRDLGFSKPVSELASGSDLEKARKAGAVSPASIAAFYFAEDIYALGYAFLEVVFSSFSGRSDSQDMFKKLFEDTFQLDIDEFRNYCVEDPDWVEAVAFLDDRDGVGWHFMKSMLSARNMFGSVSMQTLKESPFLENG